MNNNKIKMSVVTACYNSSKFLKQYLNSIINQTHTNWEIIFVDDCSTDNSIDVMKNLVKKYKIIDKVKIFQHDKNYGYGRSLYDAINRSDGEIFGIVDSDDALARNDAFELVIRKHLENPLACVVYSDYWICSEGLKPLRHPSSRQLQKGQYYLGTKIKISHLKTIKRSFYNLTEGVNPNLKKSVDKDLILKLEECPPFKDGRNLVYLNEILYLYRRHPRNITASFYHKPKEEQKKLLDSKEKFYEEAYKRRGLK